MSETFMTLLMGFSLFLQGAPAFAPAAPPEPKASPYNQVGVYLHSNNAAEETVVQNVIDTALDLGLSAMVFDVKGYRVYFQTENATVAEENNMVLPLYNLKELVSKAKSQGIYTIARYVAVKDKRLGDVVPDTRLINPATGTRLDTEWVQPAHETVLQYNREVLKEVAESGVDEINLDYIRYPSDNVFALANYTVEEKIGHLEQYIKMARDTIDEVGLGTKLGISTFAILGWHFEINVRTLAQDVTRFAPYVDVISPMAYPQTFSVHGDYYVPGLHKGSREYWLVYRTLNGYRELLGEDAYKLRPWIQGYYMTAQGMADQIQAVYDSGSCGYTVWSAGNYYTAFYAAISRGLVTIPESCKDMVVATE